MKTIITEEMRTRQRIVEYAIKNNNNAKAARRYHTSRQQVKRWRDRYDGTPQSLAYYSRRPKSHPNSHTPLEDTLVLKKYKKYGYEGLAQVYVECKKEGYTRAFTTMCKRIRKLNNKIKTEKKKYPKTKYISPKIAYPGEKVQIDIKYIPNHCIKFGPRDKNYYQITALDEYSRKRVLKVVDEKSAYHTSKFLKELEKEMGFKIKTIQTDNGSEFTNSESEKQTAFELMLVELDMEYRKIRPYSPWQNGKIERSHRIDSAYYSNKEFYSLDALERAVKKHCSRYNNIAKQILNFKSPNKMIEEYFKRVT